MNHYPSMVLGELESVGKLIELAKAEDIGTGDCSTSLLPDPKAAGRFALQVKEVGVFAGQEIAASVLQSYDESIRLVWADLMGDGSAITQVPREIGIIEGPVGAILTAERVLLNFLQRLCGIATLTRAFVDAIAGTGAVILDTRKTVPGWRILDKYAVRCGGGVNHRVGLFDAVLIKDNHLYGIDRSRIASYVFDLLNRMPPDQKKPYFVEVECPNIEILEELFKVVGIDAILLDNFSIPELRHAVELRDSLGLRGNVAFEASGGLTLDTVRAVAQTGVERISVGALTHSAPALDLSLERC